MTNPPNEPTDDPNGEPSPDLDAAFDAIVSNLRHGDRPPIVPDWPAAEDDDDPETDAPTPEEPRLGSQWSGWEDLRVEPPPEHAERGPDDHYVPPPPPPVPRGDRVVR